ncbi:hypothetical protein HK096_002413 [Nowakowskiella sp. JEL0078]|nr:hypothetical protein HK096_002413 [Nowakowskiella sp. JEL0078]
MSTSKKDISHSSISHSLSGSKNKSQIARPSFISSKSDTAFAFSRSEHAANISSQVKSLSLSKSGFGGLATHCTPADNDTLESRQNPDFSSFRQKEVKQKIQKSPRNKSLTKKNSNLSQSDASVTSDLKGDKAKIYRTPSSIPVPATLKKNSSSQISESSSVESDAGQHIVPSNRADILADNFSKLSTSANNDHHFNLPESFSDSIFAFPPNLSPLSPLNPKSPTYGAGGRRVFSHPSPNIRSFAKMPRNSVFGDGSPVTSLFMTPQRTAAPFFTPQPNLVRPTPEAFQAHSTGFLSKKNRSLKPILFAPDTPLKKKDPLTSFTFHGTPESQRNATFSSENNISVSFDPSPPTPTRPTAMQSRPKNPRSPSQSPMKSNKRPLLMASPTKVNIFHKIQTPLVSQRRMRPLNSPEPENNNFFQDTTDADDKQVTGNAAKKPRFQELLQQQQLKDQKGKRNLKVPSHKHPTDLMVWKEGTRLTQTSMDVAKASLKSPVNQDEIRGSSIMPYLNLMTPHMRELTAEYCETVWNGNGHSHLDSISQGETQIDMDYFESNFRVVTKIGEGSFGFVFKVISKSDGNLYAIKRARKAYTGYKDRMKKLQEVRLMWKIGVFPQCVRLISAWEQAGFMYMQMELCEGGSLQSYLDKTEEQMDDWNYWKILMEIAKGIEHIHSVNILHLDLKPANILVGNNWNLKISDFGVGTYCELAHNADLEGDRTYIAPEILRSEYGKPADIFSLGLMILEISQNIVLPENGINWQRLRVCDLSDFEFKGLVLKPLGELIESMLQPEPKARPSASEILQHPCIQSLEKNSKNQDMDTTI